MASTPSFVAAPNTGIGQISTANTNRDGTGTVGTILTAGASGTRIDRVVVTAQVTTTTGMIRLFIHDGSAYRLWREIAVTAATPSASVKCFQAELVSPASGLPLVVLPTGYSLRASTHNAETFNVLAEGGDF